MGCTRRPSVRTALESALLATTVLLAVACGATTIEAGGADISDVDISGPKVQCIEDDPDSVDELVALIGSGLPNVDYDVVPDLEQLVETSDLVVVGSLASGIRQEGPTNAEELEPVDSQVTFMTPNPGWEVLWSPDQAAAVSADDANGSFIMESWWGADSSADPLGDVVRFEPEAVSFLAFANISDLWPAPKVQGLLIACGEVAAPVFQPFPDETGGMPFGEVVNMVEVIADEAGGRPDREEYAVGTGIDSRGESISIPHRVLVDGVPDQSMPPWSTAVLSDDEVWAIDPDVEVGDSEVFFGFWLAESGSCPFGPTVDVRFDLEFQVLFPVVPLADGVGPDCEDDHNPHLVVVAVARDRLPGGPLTLWVDGGEPRDEGSTFVADGELTSAVESGYERLKEQGTLNVGETKIATGVSTHCGLERLYWMVDGRQWLIAPGSGIPGRWQQVVRDERIDLVITRTGVDELGVTAYGTDEMVSYLPAPDTEGCI